jgi:hypothetical protein
MSLCSQATTAIYDGASESSIDRSVEAKGGDNHLSSVTLVFVLISIMDLYLFIVNKQNGVL